MQSLKEYRSPKKAFPDLLNWGSVIDDGIVLNKDGSLMAGFIYKGRDLATATDAERNHTSNIVNATLCKLGSEWMLHQDAIRLKARHYPDKVENAFPDSITDLIEAERRAYFKRDNAHYETHYVMFFTYLPQKITQSRIQDLMFEDGNSTPKNDAHKRVGERALQYFKSALNEIEDRLSSVFDMRRMQGIPYIDEYNREHIADEMLSYMRYQLVADFHHINLPPVPMFIDSIIGSHDFWTGIIPRIDHKYIQVVAIDGFPAESYPNILGLLDQIPDEYRWNTRFLFQDAVDAQVGLRAFRRKWQQKIRGFFDQIFHSKQTASGTVNRDAVQMVAEADSALAESSSGMVNYGYYTSTIVIMNEDRDKLEESARQIKRTINNIGFEARIETVNTVEAYLGSLAGHAVQNLRRPMLNTLHLADMLPTSSVWAGEEKAPCPFYPPDSPPLLYAATSGSTPFRLNMHVGDVGHTLMLGPTGSGKSTALALIAAQFRRYENATLFAFDKGNSLEPLTKAVGGQHFNIAGNDKESDLCFAPLAGLDHGELGWIEDWVCTLFELQGLTLMPSQRNELHRALVALKDGTTERTLTNLQITIQDRGMKEALQPYTINGALGQLLDAQEDTLSMGTWACFEIEQLMYRDDKVRLLVLLYLFRVIERKLHGQPSLIILDEAWLMLGNPVFKEKIREWLKVLRKANCAVLLATQSLSDAVHSGILDVLAESCPTKIFLANREATSDENKLLYRSLGCNATEIQTIANMVAKRQYFVKGEGKRLVELAIGEVALSFVGASGKEDLKRIRELEKEYDENWTYRWLKERGVNYEHLQTV